jgi:tungstate transport system substrate-binding protein
MNLRLRLIGFMFLSFLFTTGCSRANLRIIRLATTTSTYDSGLLDDLLPQFEQRYGVRVDVIAVGTGQALALGERGDTDVVLVHNLELEERFVAQGHGLQRYPVMFNDFVIVGPKDDPAGIEGYSSAAQALESIAQAGATFISRGDDSGTHARELDLWSETGIAISPDSTWYLSLGQGMGETLLFTEEINAYTLTDRGTYLSNKEHLPGLIVLVGGNSIAENPDSSLLNPYGLIPLNPARYPWVDAESAMLFVTWFTGLEVQNQIASFGAERFGQPLFYPDSIQWQEAHP